MKGIILASFVEFAERELGGAADGLSTTSYSPVMGYPDDELFALVARTSQAAGVESPEILRRFGAHLFRTFANLYPVFLDETAGDVAADGVVLTFQIADVEEMHGRLVAAGVPFVAPPGKRFWGYGAELRDPDGHLMLLWDEVSMRENDG